MKGLLIILVLVVVVVLAVLIVSSDFGEGVSPKFDFSFIPTSSFSYGYGSGYVPSGSGNGSNGGSSSGEVGSGESGESSINPSNIPDGFSVEDLSPHFLTVKIGSVWRGKDYSRISLYAYPKSNETINVSGWTIRSNTGEMIVPQAIEVYDPYSYSAKGDIKLGRSQVLNIYSSESPVGKNFRLNECIGYLETVFDFTPPISQSCPRPDNDDLYYLKGQCQDYIRSLKSCALPDNSNPVIVGDSECKDFVDDLSYRGCFDQYRDDKNFLKREWRAWVGDLFLRMDPRHDRLLLFDKNGFLVSEKTY